MTRNPQGLGGDARGLLPHVGKCGYDVADIFKCGGCNRWRCYCEGCGDHEWCDHCWFLMQAIGIGIALAQTAAPNPAPRKGRRWQR